MWAGWSTSWNQDCQEKYQQPQICSWHQPNGRKWRGTKQPLVEDKKESENQYYILYFYLFCCFSVTQSVQLFATPWSAAPQVSLSFTISRSLLKLMSIESVMPSNHLILCHPLQSFPPSRSFLMIWLFASDGQSIGASASASVFPMNIQDWFPLGLTDLISLQSKGLSRVFSSTTVQKHQFFNAQPSLGPNTHIHTWLLE